MQKLARRVASAEGKDTRRRAKTVKLEAWKSAKQNRFEINETRKDMTEAFTEARKNRKIDWESGDLAPARHLLPDYGVASRKAITDTMATHMQFGVGKKQYVVPNLPEKHRRSIHDPVRLKINGWQPVKRVDLEDRRKRYNKFMENRGWARVPKALSAESKIFRHDKPGSYWLRTDIFNETNHFCEGDTIAVTKGPDEGKIGQIEKITDDGEGAKVKGVHLVEVKVPTWMADSNSLSNPFRAQQLPVHNKHMKLVLKSEIGLDKPVILETMHLFRRWSPEEGSYGPVKRMIPGLNIEIAMPKTEYAMGDYTQDKISRKETDPLPDIAEAYESDTLRVSSEEETFQWSLRYLPMPEGVIDELRNPFSSFRTRHTSEYIEAQQLKDDTDQKKVRSVDSMKTPIQQFNDKLRDRLEQEWNRRKAQSSMEMIGESIAKMRLERSQQASASLTSTA